MKLGCAILGMGAAFLAVNVARADDLRALTGPAASEAPWFQRFTASSGLNEGIRAAPQINDRAVTWAPSIKSNWGLTLNVRDADRNRLTGRDEATLGAFYHFTPSLRVGGEVSLSGAPLETPGAPPNDSDKSAAVKLESAFKF